MTTTHPAWLPGKELTEAERLLKLFVFGKSGSGKTRLLKTFAEDPRTSPLLVLDASGGTTGVLDDMQRHGASVRRVSDTRSILTFTDALLKNAKDQPYKALCLDDFSESFSVTKDQVAKSYGHASAEELDPREHPRLYERALKVYRALGQCATPVSMGGAGLHVIVTCWDELKPDREKEEYWVPAFAGQFGFKTPAYFDIVAYLDHDIVKDKQTKEVRFTNKLIVQSNTYLVKDRFDVIGTEMPMPTATKLLDALERSNHTSKDK